MERDLLELHPEEVAKPALAAAGVSEQVAERRVVAESRCERMAQRLDLVASRLADRIGRARRQRGG
jgi:hypothetical protein